MTTFGMSVPAANEVPPVSALSLPHYFSLSLSYNPKLKTLTQFPMTITRLDLNCSGYSYPIQEIKLRKFFIASNQPAKHLLVFHSDLLLEYGCLEESGELTFEFTNDNNYFDVIECGVQIVKEEPHESNHVGSGDKDGDSNQWNTQESGQDSDEEEEADIISGTGSEYGLSDQ
ncbi:ADP-ribosyl cyclase/cyclic ADP-ribose hydrolase [Raphanus sativus]|nr:ADP-ribosyl cyclase/cyclic ADP-ribose hydrolase [Raphanus sativus]